MPDIITNVVQLKQKSVVVENSSSEEINNILTHISNSIDQDALGLAAPQIGIHQRWFFCRLSLGTYLFINPEIIPEINEHPTMRKSSENCLSLNLPKNRCILRRNFIAIRSERMIKLTDNHNSLSVDRELESGTVLHLKSRDASIIQHEIDHLDGVLITDHRAVPTKEDIKINKKQQRKYNKKQQKKISRIPKSNKSDKPSQSWTPQEHAHAILHQCVQNVVQDKSDDMRKIKK